MNWPLLQNSLLVAGTTMALAVSFGFVAALWLATLEARWRNVFLALAVVALALPPFLVTNCWLDLLGQTGVWRLWLPLNIFSFGGSVWILSLLLWPITTLLGLSGWRRLEAAQLECDPALTGFALVRVLLVPMARGELALAAVVTFVLALNNFAVPVILQTHVLPEEMWIRYSTMFFQKPDGFFDFASLARVTWPLIIAPMVLMVLLWRRKISWPRLQGAVAARIFRRQLGAGRRTGCGVMAILLCGLSVGLPLAQIGLAKRTWAELPGAVEAGTNAAWNSFWFAAMAATVVVAVACVFSLCSRRREGADSAKMPAVRLLTSAATAVGWLPFFIPGVLLGIALIHMFNRPPFLDFYRSAGIVVLAFGVRYFALGMSGVRHAIQSTDRDLTDAAKLEGASRWQMLRHVLWPQIAPQVLAAWYVVYLLCLWDVESMVLVYPPGGETLALRIFNLLHYGYAGQVNALCLALLGLAVLPLVMWWLWEKTFNIQHSTFNIERNTKHQTPNTKKLSNSKHQMEARRAKFGVWKLGFLWCLVFGVWCFVSGCSPSSERGEASLQSKLFNRAIVIGTRGVGVGEFNKPRSVAVDLQDNVYAVDMTGRVQKFSPEGKYLLSWQMPQTDLGKPKGMGRDLDGNIVVVEPHYQQVNHFAPDGKLLVQWGCRGTNEGCFILPRAVAVNSRGEFVVSEYQGMERVQRFAIQKAEARGQKSETGNTPQQHEGTSTNWPYTKADAPLAAQSEKHAGPEAGAAGRETKLLQVIGRAGTAPGEFNRAEGVCVDAQDRLYVADSCNHRIQIFTADGKFIRAYGTAGSGLGELSYPYDVLVDSVGRIYVCEFGNSRIQIFDTNCQPVEIIGGAGSEPGRFNNPWGIAFDSHENLYVADALNHRVQKLIRRPESRVQSSESSGTK